MPILPITIDMLPGVSSFDTAEMIGSNSGLTKWCGE